MSFVNVQSKIRLEARKDAAERAVALRTQLEELASIRAPVRPPFVDKELQHLERVALTTGPASKLRQVVQQCRELADALPAAKRRSSVGAMLADSAPAADASPAAARRGSQSSYTEMPVIPRVRPPDTFQNASGTFGVGSPSSDLAAVASFLLPQMGENEGNDACRALACEGNLVSELGRHPMLHKPPNDAVVCVRSWQEADDESQQIVSVITFYQAATDLKEISVLVSDHVDQASGAIAEIAANTNRTKDVSEQAAQELASAYRSRAAMWRNMAGPSLGLLVFGIVACTPAGIPIAIGCGVASSGAGHLGARKVAALHEQAVTQIQNSIAKTQAWAPLPHPVVDRLYQDSLVAQQRFVDVMRNGDWNPYALSVRGFAAGLKVFWGSSLSGKPRVFAHKVSFRTELSPADAFRVLERARMQGELNPACRASWARQVDERGTCIRMTFFKDWAQRRNFFEVGRSSRMSDDEEFYVFASVSIAPELVDELLPLGEGAEGDANLASLSASHIHVAGVSIHDPDDGGGTQITVVADIDSKLDTRILRGHIINASKFLRQTFAAHDAQSFDVEPDEGLHEVFD